MVERHRRIRPPLLLVPAFVLAVTVHGAAVAAPYITEVMANAPPHGRADLTVGIFGHGFTPPVQVFFSDGANPTVAASPVTLDAARGIALVRVPSSAATGYMKLTANGVDSNSVYFRRNSGTFSRGTSTVSGQVLDDGLSPVAGAVVVLLKSVSCDGDSIFWDHAVTDATGHYTLHGQAQEYMLFVFPPVATGLAIVAMPVVAPDTADVVLASGTQVQGRVVLASAPGVGVANARVEFEGDGFATTLTDANGNYAVSLPPGPYDIRVVPPPSYVVARAESSVMVGSSSPQTVASIALAGGVRIHGTVRRQTDSTPLPGIGISVWPEDGSGSQWTGTVAQGDGTYTLVVPPNDTYGLSTWINDPEPYVPGRVEHLAVGTSDVQQDFSLLDGGFIRGMVMEYGTLAPLGDVMVFAFATPWGDPQPVTSAETCDNGAYTLHVPPSVTGYLVGAGGGNGTTYVPAAYDATEGTTFFPCEGTPVAVTAVGAAVAGVDITLVANPGWIEGAIVTEDSGCSTPTTIFHSIQVDDGVAHDCTLGMMDGSVPPGSYRVLGLPPVSAMPILRACVFPFGPGSGQCYDMQAYPQFTSVPVPAGGGQFGVDFCLGPPPAVPTHTVLDLRASKAAGQLTLSWSPPSDPAVAWYRVRGAASPRPTQTPGSFPADPSFHAVWDSVGTTPNVSLPLDAAYGYFLVVGVSATGMEGPSGHYPLVP